MLRHTLDRAGPIIPPMLGNVNREISHACGALT